MFMVKLVLLYVVSLQVAESTDDTENFLYIYTYLILFIRYFYFNVSLTPNINMDKNEKKKNMYKNEFHFSH